MVPTAITKGRRNLAADASVMVPTAITKGRRNLAADALSHDADRHHQRQT